MKIRKGTEGFTLVEVIAVLVILGILAAVAIPRYIDLQQNAEKRALQAGVAELNGREALTWGNTKLSDAGWTSDTPIYDAVVASATTGDGLGTEYTLSSGSSVAGTLQFKNTTTNLVRDVSTLESPARWE